MVIEVGDHLVGAFGFRAAAGDVVESGCRLRQFPARCGKTSPRIAGQLAGVRPAAGRMPVSPREPRLVAGGGSPYPLPSAHSFQPWSDAGPGQLAGVELVVTGPRLVRMVRRDLTAAVTAIISKMSSTMVNQLPGVSRTFLQNPVQLLVDPVCESLVRESLG